MGRYFKFAVLQLDLIQNLILSIATYFKNMTSLQLTEHIPETCR